MSNQKKNKAIDKRLQDKVVKVTIGIVPLLTEKECLQVMEIYAKAVDRVFEQMRGDKDETEKS